MAIQVDAHNLAALEDDGERAAYFPSDAATAPVLPRSFDVWLDPGTHTLAVSQPGVPDATATRTFAPGASEMLVFPVRTPAPHVASAELDRGRPDRTWAIVSFGIGGAGLVASGVFGILSLNLKSTLSSRCGANGVCPASDADDVDRMKRFADYSTVGVVVGGVGAAVGAYLWFTARPPRLGSRGAAPRFMPWLGVGSAGMTARF